MAIFVTDAVFLFLSMKDYKDSMSSSCLECSLGVRNLLNVVDINYTRTSLTGQTTTLNFPLSAGRSFYAKLTFNLNINH